MKKHTKQKKDPTPQPIEGYYLFKEDVVVQSASSKEITFEIKAGTIIYGRKALIHSVAFDVSEGTVNVVEFGKTRRTMDKMEAGLVGFGTFENIQNAATKRAEEKWMLT